MSTAAQITQSLRLKYPGLLPDETLVLRAWLSINEGKFDRFDYNLRIGPDIDPGPQYSDAVRQDAILLQKLRIDAVGWRGVQNNLLPSDSQTPADVYALFPSALATIIEVKRRATASSIGQIVTYREQWEAEYPDAAQPDTLLVCTTYSPAIVATLTAQGIQLNTVAVNFSVLSTKKGS